MKNKSPKLSKLEELPPLPNMQEIESRIFEEIGGEIFIGGEKVNAQMRGVLREQAKYLQTSNLWEILNATIINETFDMALRQSQDFEAVRSAKMLYHWNHVLKNFIYVLGKN